MLPRASTESEDDVGQPYEILTGWERLVCRYAGIPITEVGNLNVQDYLILRRDAYIHELSQTADGREYLQNAWNREQTDADYEALQKQFSIEPL